MKKMKAKPAPALPATDRALAHRREIENEEGEALRNTICAEVGAIRTEAKDIGDRIVVVVNRCRAVGQLVLKAWESLPGKQMTIDFWQQQQALYMDSNGNPISLDHLKWFVRVWTAEKTRPVEDVLHARSYEKDLLGLIGFNLAGDAPGTTPAALPNHFMLLTAHLPKFGQEVELRIRELERNPNFGPIEQWPSERCALALAKVGPAAASINALHDRLKKQAGVVDV